MSRNISPQSATAREQARASDGKFGAQPHDKASIELDTPVQERRLTASQAREYAEQQEDLAALIVTDIADQPIDADDTPYRVGPDGVLHGQVTGENLAFDAHVEDDETIVLDATGPDMYHETGVGIRRVTIALSGEVRADAVVNESMTSEDFEAKGAVLAPPGRGGRSPSARLAYAMSHLEDDQTLQEFRWRSGTAGLAAKLDRESGTLGSAP